MKKKILKILCIVLVLAILITGGIAVFNYAKLEKLKNLPLNLPEGFTYTAHTGCVDTPDNSLESIEVAVQYGADIVEFDLNFTSEGGAVLSHDEPVGDEVTLEEAFKKVSEYDSLRVNVDIKSTKNLSVVKPLAEKYGLSDRIFYTGVSEDFVEAVKAQSPGVPYYLNLEVKKNPDEKDFAELLEKVRKSGAIGINCDKKNVTKEMVDFFRENDCLVSVWTAKTELDIYEMLALSPDNITTRRPDIMQGIIK